MTLQAIFNIVYVALLTQNAKSVEAPSPDNEDGILASCLYRGPNGTKCAVGHLITDEAFAFDPSCNASSVRDYNVQQMLQKSGVPTDLQTIGFLGSLQRIHDSHNVEDWKAELNNFAHHHNLTIPEM